ncbi:MAG: hypothetical protein AB7I41_00965 [Candidatus Sericytochromatia bacterium]
MKYLQYRLSQGLKLTFLLLMLFFVGCENANLDPGGVEKGKGKVVDFTMEPNTRVALYLDSELKAGKKPNLEYGSMDAHFVTLDNTTFMVDWNDLADFKSLKKGQDIPYRASGYIARLEKNGKVFQVIRLNEI